MMSSPRPSIPRSPRSALLQQPWTGFRTAAEIASAFERWSLATISDQLARLAREGLIWSVRHEGAEPLHKFAHPRLDVADLVVPGPRSPLRRSWQTLQQARRIAIQAVEMPLCPPPACPGEATSRSPECEACRRTGA